MSSSIDIVIDQAQKIIISRMGRHADTTANKKTSPNNKRKKTEKTSGNNVKIVKK